MPSLLVPKRPERHSLFIAARTAQVLLTPLLLLSQSWTGA